ncbi:MAG: P-loop NTPase [Candidatus Hodarchaeota archaeon]
MKTEQSNKTEKTRQNTQQMDVKTMQAAAVERKMKVQKNMERIKYKIMVMSGKGGVGKSTVAANLSFALQLRGHSVGLLDVDIHGPNIPKMLGVEEGQLSAFGGGIFPVNIPPNLKVVSMAFLLQNRDTPVIWRGPIKMGVIEQFLGDVIWGDLDYICADLPPGTGDEPLSIAQLIPGVTGVIIVTTPQDVALLDSRKAVNFAKELHIPVIGIVENMSGLACPHCGKKIDLFKVGGGEKAAKELGVPFLGRIPIDPAIVLSGDAGKPFLLEDPNSEAAKAFNQIVENIETFVTATRN